jgi:hypothetical protein
LSGPQKSEGDTSKIISGVGVTLDVGVNTGVPGEPVDVGVGVGVRAASEIVMIAPVTGMVPLKMAGTPQPASHPEKLDVLVTEAW